MSSSRRDQSNSRAPAPPPAQDGASRQLLPMAAPSVTASMAARSGNPVNIVNGIPVTPSTFPRQQVLQPARQGTQITGSEDGRDARTDEEQYDGDDDDLDGQLMPIQDPRSGPHVITVPSVIVARSDVPSHQAPKLRTQKNTGIRVRQFFYSAGFVPRLIFSPRDARYSVGRWCGRLGIPRS